MVVISCLKSQFGCQVLVAHNAQGKLYHQGQDQVLKCCLEDSKIPTLL